MNNDKLIAKLKKLLAMSQGKANENEAMVAARQLHVLLSKHNISISQLNEESKEKLGETEFGTKDRPWKRIVAVNIAKLYFCDMFYTRLGGGRSVYTFVGTEANRMFAQSIFDMVIKTVERESRRASKAEYGREVSGFVNSFWTGASNRISARCKELMVDAKHGKLQDEEGNTLPVMLSVYEQAESDLSDYLAQAHPNLKKKSTNTRVTDRAGHHAGVETGNRVQLSRALKNAGPKPIGN